MCNNLSPVTLVYHAYFHQADGALLLGLWSSGLWILGSGIHFSVSELDWDLILEFFTWDIILEFFKLNLHIGSYFRVFHFES